MKKLLWNSLLCIAALSWAVYAFHGFMPQLTGEVITEFFYSIRPALSRLGVVDIVLVSWLWIVCYWAGTKVLDVLEINCDPGAERLSLSTGVGLALVTLLAFVFAAVRMLHDLVAFGLLLVPVLFYWNEFKTIGSRTWICLSGWQIPSTISIRSIAHALLIVYISIVLVIVLISALGPEIEWDAMAYHLPAAKAMVQSRGFKGLPDIPLTFFPKNVEILFSLGMILHSEITAKLVHYLFGLLTLIATYGFAKRFHSQTVGLLAVAILAASPIFIWEMRTAHIDCGFAFAVFASVYAMVIWLETAQQSWFWLAAFFTAWSLGTRYQALFSLGALATLVFIWMLRGQRNLRMASLQAGRFFLFASIGLIPWGIVNLIQTGNPIFPLLNGIFKSPYWSSQQTNTILEQQAASGLPVGLSNWWAVVTNFYNLSVDRPDFHGNIGLFYLILVPLLLFQRRIDRVIKLILGFSIIYWLFWIFTGQHARYLLAILPGMAIGSAYGLARWLDALSLQGRRLSAAIAACLLAFLAVFQSPLFERYGASSRYGNPLLASIPWDTLVGNESRDHYLSRYLLAYPVVEYLNGLPGKKKVLFWWNADPPVFYVDGVSAYSFSKFFAELYVDNPAQLAQVLHRNGVTHVVVEQLRQEEQFFSDPEKEFVQRYLKNIYQKNSVILYEVSPGPLIQETVSFDFLDHIREAAIKMPAEPAGKPNTDFRSVVQLADETRYVLVTHPPAEVDFTVTVPENPVMRFALGRRWPPCTSKGSFQLWAAGSDGIRRLLFDREVSEPNSLNQSAWFDEELDLNAFAGQRVTMMFQTSLPEPGACDWFLWADPQIISRP